MRWKVWPEGKLGRLLCQHHISAPASLPNLLQPPHFVLQLYLCVATVIWSWEILSRSIDIWFLCHNLFRHNFFLWIICSILITWFMGHKYLWLFCMLCCSTLGFSEWVSESNASRTGKEVVCWKIFCIFWIHVWWICHNNRRAQQSRRSHSLTFG